MFLVISIFLLLFARKILTFSAMIQLLTFAANFKRTRTPMGMFNIETPGAINTEDFLAYGYITNGTAS